MAIRTPFGRVEKTMNREDINAKLRQGIEEIYDTKGIDSTVRDRRVRFLLHNLNVIMDKDLLAMEKYEQ